MKRVILTILIGILLALSTAIASAIPNGQEPFWNHVCHAHGGAFASAPPNGLPPVGLRAQNDRCKDAEHPAGYL